MTVNKQIILDIIVLKRAITEVRKLHQPEEPSEITNKIYCAECQYEYPCQTIKIVGANG